MSLHRILALASTALALATPATASSVHLDFQAGTNTNTGHSHLTYSAGGATLIVTAWTTAPTPGAPRSGGYGRVTPLMGSAGGENAGIYDGDSGLGVFQAGTDSKNLDGGDGSGEPDEGIMFLFDREVELTRMNFNFWDGRDNYPTGSGFGDSLELFVDNVSMGAYQGAADRPFWSYTGTMFVLLATDDATSVRIQDLDFRVLGVPEPGSLALVGAALLGLRMRQRPVSRA